MILNFTSTTGAGLEPEPLTNLNSEPEPLQKSGGSASVVLYVMFYYYAVLKIPVKCSTLSFITIMLD